MAGGALINKKTYMGVNIHYQGFLVENTGVETEIISETASTKIVIEAVVKKYPALKNLNFVIAVNGLISHQDVKLKEGDSVTLIPPAPGG